MIASFSCRDTLALFAGEVVRRFAPFRAQAERKLLMLECSTSIEDLRVPPGNRLEKLSGDRAGQWSIRINDQWRLCFRFAEGNAHDVEIVDYH
jgi:proteic killer suppression protein